MSWARLAENTENLRGTMRRFFMMVTALALLWSPLRSPCQMVTVTASKLSLSPGTKVTGVITFTPTLSNGTLASYKAPSGGQVIAQPVSVPVTDGVFTISLPDVTLTTPANICFAAAVKSNTGGQLGAGYNCLQPHGTAVSTGDWCQSGVCNFDNYLPSVTGQPATYYSPTRALQVVQDATTNAGIVTLATSGVNASFGLQLSESIPTRTLNATGLVAGNNFALLITPPIMPPIALATGGPITWAASTAVTAGQSYVDGNNHLQEVTTAGTTGTSEPAWSTTGGNTTDGTATWKDLGPPLGIQLGSGCTWQAASTSGLNSLANGLVVAPGASEQILLSVQYDGTNCNLMELE